MKKVGYILRLGLGVCLFLSAASVVAGVPELISYQGRLLDSAGNPVPDGVHSVTFSLYEVPVEGAPFWSETHSTVSVSNGLFSVILGSLTPFSPAATKRAGSDIWMGITVGSDPEISPRAQLLSVPFAFNADRADTSNFSFSSDNALNAETAQFAYNADQAGHSQFSDTAHYAFNHFDNWADTAGFAYSLADSVILGRHVVRQGLGLEHLASNGATDGMGIVWSDFINGWVPSTVGTGNISSVYAGDGLSGGGNSGVVSLDVAAEGINSAHIAAGAVGSSELAAGSVETSKIAAGAVGSSQLAAGAVTGEKIAGSAVTTALIADGSVSASDLATDAVGASNIQDGAVTTAKIGLNAIHNGHIQTGTIGSSDIGDGQVQSIDLATGIVSNSKLAPSAVTGDKIQDGTITGADIASETITSAHLSSSSVGTGELVNASVTAIKLAPGAISSGNISNEVGLARSINYIDLEEGPRKVLDSVEITLPTNGYIFASVSFSCGINHSPGLFNDPTSLTFYVTSHSNPTSAEAINAARTRGVRLDGGISGGTYAFPTTITEVFPMSAGTVKYYFVGWNLNNDTAVINDISFAVMFIPTAYGTVDNSWPN